MRGGAAGGEAASASHCAATSLPPNLASIFTIKFQTPGGTILRLGQMRSCQYQRLRMRSQMMLGRMWARRRCFASAESARKTQIYLLSVALASHAWGSRTQGKNLM